MLLKSIDFLSGLGELELVRMLYSSAKMQFRKGDTIKINENGFFIILSGTVHLSDKGVVVKKLIEKDTFGILSKEYMKNPQINFIAANEVRLLYTSFGLLYEMMAGKVSVADKFLMNLVNELAAKSDNIKLESYA